MIKMIDDVGDEEITGYGYLNHDNDLEEVIEYGNSDEILTICVDGNEVHVYKSDVPKLVRALTLAAKL